MLAQRLLPFKCERSLVLALPRGGVPVGFEVARMLEAPLDLVLVRKIGAPFQLELAIGAVVNGTRVEMILNEEMVREFQIPDSYLAEESARQLEEIERRRGLYLAGAHERPSRAARRSWLTTASPPVPPWRPLCVPPAGPIRSASCSRFRWRHPIPSSGSAPRLTNWSASPRRGYLARSARSMRTSDK